MEMNKSITYSQLEAVLLELGFRKKVIPKEGVTYGHLPSKTLLLLPLHEPAERVPSHVILSVRHHLEWNGVIEPNVLEEMLQAAAA